MQVRGSSSLHHSLLSHSSALSGNSTSLGDSTDPDLEGLEEASALRSHRNSSSSTSASHRRPHAMVKSGSGGERNKPSALRKSGSGGKPCALTRTGSHDNHLAQSSGADGTTHRRTHSGGGGSSHYSSASQRKPLGLYKQDSMTQHSVGRSDAGFDEDDEDEEEGSDRDLQEDDEDDDEFDRATIPGQFSKIHNKENDIDLEKRTSELYHV